MKKILASLVLAVFFSGCTTYKTVPHYTPNPENTEIILTAAETPINIGEFSDASFRKELTCKSLAIVDVPDDLTYADLIRHALIDEFSLAKRYDPQSPVTITALLNRIDFDTEKGIWIIRMTLASSNGKTMTIETLHEYNSIGLGEVACIQAAANYRPALKKLMKSLLSSPDFAELTKNTPPEAISDKNDINNAPDTNEKTTVSTKTPEPGKERIRRRDSLEAVRKAAP